MSDPLLEKLIAVIVYSFTFFSTDKIRCYLFPYNGPSIWEGLFIQKTNKA